MKRQALGAIKWKIALVADGGGLLLFIIIGAWIGLIAVAGPAGSPLAGMISGVVVVITAVALVAPIAFVYEAGDFGASFIMGVRFQQDDFLFSVWATEKEKEGVLAAEDLQLIGWVQGGQVLLEFFQFGQTARSFGYPCHLMQLTGHDALAGPSFSKSLPVVLRHVTRIIAVTPGLHGHDGPGAAKVVLVMDGDDALFPLTVLLERSQSHIVFFSSTAGGWHPD